MDEDPYFAFKVDGLSVTKNRAIRTCHVISAILDAGASLGRRRDFLVIFRANVFHDSKLPR